jgi:predicted  nucleic acid-binding Zn-ribbon protein
VVAPISLFLSFETLMAMLKSDVQRGVAAATLAQLTGQADQVRAGLVAAQQQTETMTAKRDQVQHELTELRKEKRNIVRGFGAVSDDTRSRAYDILSTRVASGEDISGAELGRLLGKAATTGRNLKKELWPIITGNGNGNTPTNGGSPQ